MPLAVVKIHGWKRVQDLGAEAFIPKPPTEEKILNIVELVGWLSLLMSENIAFIAMRRGSGFVNLRGISMFSFLSIKLFSL